MLSKGILVIVGPTACGKTEASIGVANRMNAEIISADSVQIYQRLDIGSAKPTEAEMRGVSHHLIGEIPLDAESYSVAQYQQRAFDVIDQIHAQNKQALIVGGTGLYINSLVFPMEFTASSSNIEFRRKMTAQELLEPGSAYRQLQKTDPESAKRIHANDLKRVVRALEVYYTTGKTMTAYNLDNKNKPLRYKNAIIGLTMPRDLLYSRIEKRVDLMIQEGLVQEVEQILADAFDANAISLQGLGYKEIISALQGNISLDEAIAKVKLETRHFAKRQITWFTRNHNIDWFDITQYSAEDLQDEICSYFEDRVQEWEKSS